MHWLIEQNIPAAQAAFRAQPFKKGQVVAHPSEPITGELESLDESTGLAIVNFINQPSQQFPYAELFDPNELRRMCIDARDKMIVASMAELGLETVVIK